MFFVDPIICVRQALRVILETMDMSRLRFGVQRKLTLSFRLLTMWSIDSWNSCGRGSRCARCIPFCHSR